MTNQPYSIVIISSEFSPLAKTGGLGDMVAALAAGFKRNGHDVHVVLPLYGQIKESPIALDTTLPSMCVTMGIGEVWCAVRHTVTSEKVPLYFIEHEDFFRRMGFYHDPQYRDYPDNPLRFGFFCRAALQLLIDLDLKPDVVQVNDWQTALAPAYLKTWFWDHPSLGRCVSLLTIHNAPYQGIFPASHYRWLGLPSHDSLSDIYEGDGGRMNFLKAGIHFADIVNTVSPTYAREMKTSVGSSGLAPMISKKGERFRGILNGVDYDTWSPEKDRLIPARYCAEDMSGKTTCKMHLQEQFRLEGNAGIALIGFIGRLTRQKGVHLLRETVERIVNDMVVQVVILGSGNPRYEQYFRSLPARYPGKIGVYIGFHEEMAHLIEAGADFFVMPSLYEPCGLNQMYSLRYGTLPIVHATGGLDDTVENYDEATGNGTGFKFWDNTADAFYYTVGWAVSTYYDRPDHLRMLREKAMKQNFSWDRSVDEYERLIETAMAVKR